jgi:hypothetical protein
MDKKPKSENWLVFIDTNVFLDFYRSKGDYAVRVLQKLDPHKDSIILTDQVWMEFLKNRQKVILDGINQVKFANQNQIPAIVSGSSFSKNVEKSLLDAKKGSDRLKTMMENILINPERNDTVYKALNKFFNNPSPIYLDRKSKTRFEIRRLARKRFFLGYPPRKNGDTSFGDAINWEWIVHCAKNDAKKSNIVIVSRDTDYGITIGEKYILNDWLKKEFSERVGKRRKILLTPNITKALKILNIPVSRQDEKEERELVGRGLTDIGELSRIFGETNFMKDYQINEINESIRKSTEGFKGLRINIPNPLKL